MRPSVDGPNPAGVEFDELSPAQQAVAVSSLTVFSRVEPTHKSRLIELLKAQVCARARVSVCLTYDAGVGVGGGGVILQNSPRNMLLFLAA